MIKRQSQIGFTKYYYLDIIYYYEKKIVMNQRYMHFLLGLLIAIRIAYLILFYQKQ